MGNGSNQDDLVFGEDELRFCNKELEARGHAANKLKYPAIAAFFDIYDWMLTTREFRDLTEQEVKDKLKRGAVP